MISQFAETDRLSPEDLDKLRRIVENATAKSEGKANEQEIERD